MSPVEPAGVSAQKPFHSCDQIGLRRLNHQMKMIGHQTIRMHLPARLEAGLAQCAQESLAVGVILEDRLTAIPSVEDVIKGSRILDSQLARHERNPLNSPQTCQYY